MFRLIIISLLAVSSWMSALEASSLLDNSYLSVSDDSAKMCIKTSINVSSINNVSLENVDIDIKKCLSDVLELQLNDKDYGTLFKGGFKNLISKAPIFVYADNTSENLQYSAVNDDKQIFGLNFQKIVEAYEEIDNTAWTLDNFIKSSMAHEMGHQYLLYYYEGLRKINLAPVSCVQEAFATYAEILYAMKENSGVFSRTGTFRETVTHILNDYIYNDAPVETKYALNARYLYCLCICLDYNNPLLGFNYDVLEEVDIWAKYNKGGKFYYGEYDYNQSQAVIERKDIEKLKKKQKPTIINCLKRIQSASIDIATQEKQ